MLGRTSKNTIKITNRICQIHLAASDARIVTKFDLAVFDNCALPNEFGGYD